MSEVLWGGLLVERKRTGSFALVAWLLSSLTGGRRCFLCAIEKNLLLQSCEKGFPGLFLALTDGETVEEGSRLEFVNCAAEFSWIEHSNDCFKCLHDK